MDGDPDQPLTPEEAKARLREAALRLSPRQWIRQHPLAVLAAALAGGLVIGRVGTVALARALMLRRLTPALLMLLFPKGRKD